MKKLLIACSLLLVFGCGGTVSTPDGSPVVDHPNPQIEAPNTTPPTLEGRPTVGSVPIIRDAGETATPPVRPTTPSTATFTPLGFLSGGSTSEAYAISPDGSFVTGTSVDEKGTRTPFLWNEATGMQPLPVPQNRPDGEGHALSQTGSVVGGLGTLFDIFSAQIWTNGGVFQIPGAVPPDFGPQMVSDLTPDGLTAVGTAGTGIIGFQGYVWKQGDANPAGLGSLGAPNGQKAQSEGHAISADGNVITGISTTSSGGLSAYSYSHGVMSALPVLDGLPYSDGWGVSADGTTIVGWSSATSKLVPAQATLWRAGVPVSLGQLPGFTFNSQAYGASGDGSIVVGAAASSQSFTAQAAFVWDANNGMRRLQEVLGSAVPEGWNLLAALDVSDDGRTVTGFGIDPNGQIQAFTAQLP